MRPPKASKLADNEQGFASIVIALVLIIILGLLTVGFAQLARREQQQALDKQLSTQAYYAAESGINDSIRDINSGAINSANASPTTCMTAATGLPTSPVGPIPAALTASPNIGPAANGVSYTCLLVNLKPSSLVFNDTPPGSGQYLAFSTSAQLKALTIQWGSFDKGNSTFNLSSATYPTGAKFPSSGTWNSQNFLPLLQFSLTPTNSGPSISRANLIDNTFTPYLYPAKDHSGYGLDANPKIIASTDVTYDTTQQGQIVPGNCGQDGSSTYPCSVTITGLNGTGSSYLMHYLDFYDATNVYITGTDTSGNPVTFTGQVLIDVTGKAHNVLRRLQARLDASGANGNIVDPVLLPDSALQGQNICKRLQTRPAVNNPNPSPPNTDYINPTGTNVNASSTDACNLDN